MTDEPMSDPPRFRLAGTVLATRDARGLASFYERLLGWPRVQDDAGWVVLHPGGESSAISFHEDVEYVAPVWPSRADRQQIMSHLDIGTNDLEAAIAHARAIGATDAEFQPQSDVRVMLDPDGHPFCLFRSERA